MEKESGTPSSSHHPDHPTGHAFGHTLRPGVCVCRKPTSPRVSSPISCLVNDWLQVPLSRAWLTTPSVPQHSPLSAHPFRSNGTPTLRESGLSSRPPPALVPFLSCFLPTTPLGRHVLRQPPLPLYFLISLRTSFHPPDPTGTAFATVSGDRQVADFTGRISVLISFDFPAGFSSGHHPPPS